MIRLSLAALAALAAAAWLAFELEGALGTGVLAGALLGSSLAGLSSLYLGHVLRTRPQHALRASLLGFLFALGAVLSGTLAFRFVEPAGARVDWRGFAIAFAACAALLLPLGAWEAVRAGRQRLVAG